MWLTPKLFFYFYLPEICLFYLVAWWIYRRNRAQKLPCLIPYGAHWHYEFARSLKSHMSSPVRFSRISLRGTFVSDIIPSNSLFV